MALARAVLSRDICEEHVQNAYEQDAYRDGESYNHGRQPSTTHDVPIQRGDYCSRIE